jgi:hypothetical protein
MRNANIEINPTQSATVKQLYAVGKHFAKLNASNSSEAWMLSKAYPAAMMRWNAEHSTTPITMGDIQTWFESDKVPTKFTKMLTVQKPRTKTSKKSPAASKPKPKASPKPEAKASSKPSEMPVGDFKDHFEKITGRVFRLEESIKDHSQRLSGLDAKLDIIMAYITETPDSE